MIKHVVTILIWRFCNTCMTVTRSVWRYNSFKSGFRRSCKSTGISFSAVFPGTQNVSTITGLRAYISKKVSFHRVLIKTGTPSWSNWSILGFLKDLIAPVCSFDSEDTMDISKYLLIRLLILKRNTSSACRIFLSAYFLYYCYIIHNNGAYFYFICMYFNLKTCAVVFVNWYFLNSDHVSIFLNRSSYHLQFTILLFCFYKKYLN